MQDVPFATREVAFSDHKQLVIHPLSDVHIGAHKHVAKALAAKLKAIMAAGDNHRVLLMGDLADTATPISKHYEPGAVTPQAELEELVRVFKPIAERVDLIIPGNHEERLLKVGLDLTAQFAALIGRPDAYRPLPTVIRYLFNKRKDDKNAYRARAELYVHHGYGGGRNEGPKLDRVKSLALQKPDCHAYMMGHVHSHGMTMDEVPLGWPVKRRRRVYVTTGTYLDSEAYAIKANYPPGAVNSPVLYLDWDSTSEDVIASAKLG